jgi:pilus assembly protein Flp/PilA
VTAEHLSVAAKRDNSNGCLTTGFKPKHIAEAKYALQEREKEKGSKMKKFADSVKKFLVSEDGPTAVEYAVMLALIIVVCLAAISAVGTKANAKFDEVGSYLS